MSTSVSFTRAALVAGVILLGLSACGRRGAPEPPPNGAAPQEVQPQGAAEPSTLPSPVGTPREQPRRGYTIPKDPFFLDPLL